MADAQAVLELVFDTSKLKTATSDIKSVTTETTKATSAITKMGTESKSVGSKIGEIGKKFSGTIASIGTLSATTLNLKRSYEDLGDAQIKVDKTQLKVSKTAEASTKAHAALNKLLAAGVKSGAAYDQAMLDVKQAEEASTLAVTMHGEALEDQQRIQENFWSSLIPTITSAGGTVVSMLKEMGGTKGLAGLGTKVKDLIGGGKGGIGGLIGSLTGSGGLTGSLDSAKTAATGFGGALASMAVGAGAGIAGALLIIQQIKQMQDELEAQGIRMAKTKFGGALFSLPELQLSANQLDEIMQKTHFSIAQIMGDAEGTKKAWVDAGGAVDEAGNIIFSTANTVSDLGEKFTATSQDYIKWSVNLLKAGKSAADVTKFLKDSQIGNYDAQKILTEATKQYQASLQTVTPAQNSFKSSLDTTIPSMTTVGGTFATITANIGPATTGIAGLNSQMNPFNATLLATGANAKTAGQGLQAMGQAAQKSASLALQASQAAARAAQNMANAAAVSRAVASGGIFSYGAGFGFGENDADSWLGRAGTRGPQFGPLHGNPVKGAANPNFRLRSDYQKAKIVKPKKKKHAQFGLHEFLTEDTMIMAHKGEIAHIDKPSRMGDFSPTINVFVDGVERPARYSIGTRK